MIKRLLVMLAFIGVTSFAGGYWYAQQPKVERDGMSLSELIEQYRLDDTMHLPLSSIFGDEWRNYCFFTPYETIGPQRANQVAQYLGDYAAQRFATRSEPAELVLWDGERGYQVIEVPGYVYQEDWYLWQGGVTVKGINTRQQPASYILNITNAGCGSIVDLHIAPD